MKLVSIEIENYRSIQKKQILNLDQPLTVIIGPNNEGKSNLLRAVVLAMKTIRYFRFDRPIPIKDSSKLRFRVIHEDYSWESDFPRQFQSKNPEGETILRLEFRLNDKERADFKKRCAIANNGVLPVEITLGKEGGVFKVRKPGRGAGSYGKKTPNIAKFISEHFEFQYIPAIRTEKLSLSVVENLLDRELEREISNLKSSKEYNDAIETISKIQQPIYDRLGKDIQEQIKKLLPSVRKVTISQPKERGREYRYRSFIRTPELIIDDGIATSLEAKGDGIKSLTAISLMRTSKNSQESGDLVVAIEEPESHLHPAAVRQLSGIIQEMSLEHQVVITTHSPLLVARSNLEANIIVTKSKASPASSIKSIRDSLGIEMSDNLSVAEYVILLEGKHDIRSVHSIFGRSQQFTKFLEKGKVVFDQLDGTGNVAYKIQNLRHSVASPILIVDGDKSGRDSVKKAEKDGALEQKYMFSWNRPNFQETELEDLFDIDLYWNTLCEKLGATLNRQNFEQSNEKWSDRFKKAYQVAGKPWANSVENDAKKILADLVSENPDAAIKQEFKILVDNILSAVTRIIVPH